MSDQVSAPTTEAQDELVPGFRFPTLDELLVPIPGQRKGGRTSNAATAHSQTGARIERLLVWLEQYRRTVEQIIVGLVDGQRRESEEVRALLAARDFEIESLNSQLDAVTAERDSNHAILEAHKVTDAVAVVVANQLALMLGWRVVGSESKFDENANCATATLEFDNKWQVSVSPVKTQDGRVKGFALIELPHVLRPAVARIDAEGFTATGLLVLQGQLAFSAMSTGGRASLTDAQRAKIFVTDATDTTEDRRHAQQPESD